MFFVILILYFFLCINHYQFYLLAVFCIMSSNIFLEFFSASNSRKKKTNCRYIIQPKMTTLMELEKWKSHYSFGPASSTLSIDMRRPQTPLEANRHLVRDGSPCHNKCRHCWKPQVQITPSDIMLSHKIWKEKWELFVRF